MASVTTMIGKRERLTSIRFHDGEEYFDVDWEKVLPEVCNLDYDSRRDHKGVYAEIFDTNTGTLIARTRSYKDEDAAFTAADRIMEHLRTEFYFEENPIWKKNE